MATTLTSPDRPDRPKDRRPPTARAGGGQRAGIVRTGTWLAAVVAATVAIVLILNPGGSYTIHALFEDAGQLVNGGEVQIAGRPVGTISGISVTPNGLADITLSLSSGVGPLHRGTRAIIRALGQAGVANRYVQLFPGPASGPILHSGATLPTTQTTGIVDLDAVLDAFTPATRDAIQQLLANSSQVFAGSGADYFNELLAQADPAVEQLKQLTGQVAYDNVALGQLVSAGANAAHAVETRSTDLQNAVVSTAGTLEALASQKAALRDLLRRAPGTLKQATGTLTEVASTAQALRPTLRLIVPVGAPLRGFLDQLTPTLRQSAPVLRALTNQLPMLRTTLAGLRPLAAPAVAALSSTQHAVSTAEPILAGLREYGADFFLGLFNGLAGISSGTYNSEGHYVHVEFVQPYQSFLSGPLSTILTSPGLENNLFAERTKLTARCPGGNEPPSPDGSSPWVIPSICNPADDTPLSVDFP